MDIFFKSCSTHGKPNLCDKCNQKFDYPSDYIKHYQDIHGSLPPEYKDKETFVCDQCPRVFITKNHLGKIPFKIFFAEFGHETTNVSTR